MQTLLKSVRIQGYRPFRDFSASFGPLEVIVGANGSGKSSLFEFLRFLRDSVDREIPPEIVHGSVGQQIFHNRSPAMFSWNISVDFHPVRFCAKYQGEIRGPVGRPDIAHEHIEKITRSGAELLMEVKNSNGFMQEGFRKQTINLERGNRLALSLANDSFRFQSIYALRDYIYDWRFHDSFKIDRGRIRNPVLVEQNPILSEDAGNLSSVLHYLQTEHQSKFDELQQHLRSTVPGFKELKVKAYGAPGNIMAFWQEEGSNKELTLADLSDGILQLMCWVALFMQPDLPPLICVDEPTLGLHPRMLPTLAGVFKKASNDTQILLTTHSSYFLTLFDRSQIAVMRKEDGEAKFVKPSDSKVLIDILEDFGPEEIEALHISDELEYFA